MSKKISSLFSTLLSSAVVIAAVNVVYVLTQNGYDLSLGPLHLEAHGLFKPLLILNGVFILSFLLREPREILPAASTLTGRAPIAVVAILVVVVFGFSFTVNPLYDEWNYRALSSGLKTIGDLGRLFTSPQFSAWYRPLGFLSLWVDYHLFHEHLWGYHLQNACLHAVNALLAFNLSRRFGMSAAVAPWAALLYLTAAVTYEPVMWPSARFDLLAMMFTGLSLIAFADFLSHGSPPKLALALGWYSLAVLSKESGYALPVLAAVLAFDWAMNARTSASQTKGRIVALAVGLVSATGLLVAIRLAVIGGLGGYLGTGGVGSPHLAFSLASVRAIVTRVMPMSLLSVNLNYPVPRIVAAAIGAFALLLAAGAVTGASTTPRQRILTIYALGSAIPVATIVSSVDLSAQQVRYLYMPAFFVMILVTAVLSNTRWPAVLLSALAFLNLWCGAYNIWVYKVTYRHADELAGRIALDYSRWRGPAHVTLIDMPAEFNGVLFSRFQLQYRLEEQLPNVKVDFKKDEECADQLCYIWQADQRKLVQSTRK